MASSDLWFAFYIGDYLADTMHLSRDEHGGYDLLLFAYYKNRGPLPDDDTILARITKSTVTDWQKIRSAMSKFFQVGDGVWRHKRADFEIEKRISTQQARIQGAAKTNAKLGRTVTDTMTDTVTDLKKGRSGVGLLQSQSQSQSQSDTQPQEGCGEVPVGNGNGEHKKLNLKGKSRGTKEEIEAYCEAIGLPRSDGEAVFNKWEGNGWKNGSQSIKDWKATCRSWKSYGYFPSLKEANQKNGKNFVTPYQQKEALKEKIEKHPCNRNSINYTGNQSPDQHTEYKSLKTKLETLTSIIANGGR